MPTEYVKKQLLSLEFAQPESYDEKTNTYFIPRYRGPIYEVGNCYLIKLFDNLTKETLLSWNNSKMPNSKLLKVIVNTKLGKLIKVDAVEIEPNSGRDLGTMWFGWLNIDYLEQISILT